MTTEPNPDHSDKARRHVGRAWPAPTSPATTAAPSTFRDTVDDYIGRLKGGDMGRSPPSSAWSS